jgi:hypothetical protein
MQTIAAKISFDDNTADRGQTINKWYSLLHGASEKFGKPMCTVETWKEKFEKAGFKNIHQEIYKAGELLSVGLPDSRAFWSADNPGARTVASECMANKSQIERTGPLSSSKHDGGPGSL